MSPKPISCNYKCLNPPHVIYASNNIKIIHPFNKAFVIESDKCKLYFNYLPYIHAFLTPSRVPSNLNFIKKCTELLSIWSVAKCMLHYHLIWEKPRFFPCFVCFFLLWLFQLFWIHPYFHKILLRISPVTKK